MRRLILLAALPLALVACGSSGTSGSASSLQIKLGVTGGNLVPYGITIAPGGAVTTTGTPPAKPQSVSSAKDAELSRLVRSDFGALKSEVCTGTLPDIASRYITALGRTVTVRGDCEPGFTKLWDALTGALGLNV